MKNFFKIFFFSLLLANSHQLIAQLNNPDNTWKEFGGHIRFKNRIEFTGKITPAQITADQNNYSPTGLSAANRLLLSSDASRNITGLDSLEDGTTLFITNVGAFDIILKDESSSSLAKNRFSFGADITLSAGGLGVLIQYDTAAKRWRGYGGSGGGSGSADGLGLLHVVGQYGLIQVNDSTVKVDTSLISTTANATNLYNILNGTKLDISTATSTYTPLSRTITINGSTQDLSANRTWNVGTVTQSQLDDSTEAIRADFPSGTPTLQQVTDAGATTTNDILAAGLFIASNATGIKLNIDLSGNVVSTGYSAGITQNNSNGELYFQPSATSQTSGLAPAFGTPNLTLLPDGSARLNNYTSTGSYAGTPVGVLGFDASGNILTMATPTGGGTNNANVDAGGYKILIPSTQELKELFPGNGILLDTSSNTDGLTFKVDTTVSSATSNTTNLRTKKILDSLQAAGWGAQTVNYEPWYKYYLDITGGSNATFTPVVSGTGASQLRINPPPADGWMGAMELKLGTTTTGFNILQISNASTYTGVTIDNSYRFNFGIKVRFEDLSDATDTYHFMAGFADHNYISSSVVDGVWFSYTNADSSGKFVCNTRSNSTSTGVATTTVAADTDYELEISVFGGSAYFYINKTLVATISTNIPTGVARATQMTAAIRKSAGTNSRSMYMEWLAFGKRRN